MKIKKQVMLLLFFGVVVALSSCNQASSGTDVIFWMQNYGDVAMREVMDKTAEAFQEETGYKVEVNVIDWSSADKKYTLAMQGGDSPDVAEWFWLAARAKQGGNKYGPLEINDIARDLGTENYYPSALNESKIGDDYYAMPWRMDVRVLAYRSDWFEEAGLEVPNTWEEFLSAAEKLTIRSDNGRITRSGVLLSALKQSGRHTSQIFMAQNNATLLNSSGNEEAIDSPESIEALQFMQDLVYKYKVTAPSSVSNTTDATQEFLLGKGAMLVGPNVELTKLIEANAPQLKDKVKFAVYPSKTGSGPSSIAFAAPVSVMKTAQNIKAAKTWLKFFLQPQIQKYIVFASGNLSSDKRIMADSLFAAPRYKIASAQALRALNGDYAVPFWGAISAFPIGPHAEAVNQILAGENVEMVVKETARKFQEIIDQAE